MRLLVSENESDYIVFTRECISLLWDKSKWSYFQLQDVVVTQGPSTVNHERDMFIRRAYEVQKRFLILQFCLPFLFVGSPIMLAKEVM